MLCAAWLAKMAGPSSAKDRSGKQLRHEVTPPTLPEKRPSGAALDVRSEDAGERGMATRYAL